MIHYDTLLHGVIQSFSDAMMHSNGSIEDSLSKFNIPRFKRLALLDPKEVYPPHASLLRKLHFRSNWKHELHHEILKAKPRSVQPGVVYIDHGDLIGDWSDLEYISVLFQKPHETYLFIKLDYHPKTLCIDKLYACKVTKLEEHVFNLYSVEGKIGEILDLLYSFSIH